jgi:hypothetical protein
MKNNFLIYKRSFHVTSFQKKEDVTSNDIQLNIQERRSISRNLLWVSASLRDIVLYKCDNLDKVPLEFVSDFAPYLEEQRKAYSDRTAGIKSASEKKEIKHNICREISSYLQNTLNITLHDATSCMDIAAKKAKKAASSTSDNSEITEDAEESKKSKSSKAKKAKGSKKTKEDVDS